MKVNNSLIPNYFFDWKGGLVLFLGGFIPMLIFSFLNVVSMFVLHKNFQYNDLFLILTNAVMWMSAIWAFDLFICRPQTGKKLTFNFAPKNFGTYLIIFPMMLGMMLIAEFLTSQIPITGPFFGKFYEFFSQLMEQMTNNTATMIVLAVIMAPIFEEIVFRGIIQRGLINKGMQPMTAIWISAVAFGIIHGNPWQFVGAILLGFVMGVVYEKTKSLLLPILLHAFNNLASTLLIEFYGIENFAHAFNVSEYLLLGIGLLLFGVFYFVFMKKYRVIHN